MFIRFAWRQRLVSHTACFIVPDIAPLGGIDWTVNAIIDFQKLVDKKSFVSTVVDIDDVDDGFGGKRRRLKLSLCDTSDEINDAFIEDILVEQNLARRVELNGN